MDIIYDTVETYMVDNKESYIINGVAIESYKYKQLHDQIHLYAGKIPQLYRDKESLLAQLRTLLKKEVAKNKERTTTSNRIIPLQPIQQLLKSNNKKGSLKATNSSSPPNTIVTKTTTMIPRSNSSGNILQINGLDKDNEKDNKTYQCRICKDSLSYKSSLVRHLKNKHNIKEEYDLYTNTLEDITQTSTTSSNTTTTTTTTTTTSIVNINNDNSSINSNDSINNINNNSNSIVLNKKKRKNEELENNINNLNNNNTENKIINIINNCSKDNSHESKVGVIFSGHFNYNSGTIIRDPAELEKRVLDKFNYAPIILKLNLGDLGSRISKEFTRYIILKVLENDNEMSNKKLESSPIIEKFFNSILIDTFKIRELSKVLQFDIQNSLYSIPDDETNDTKRSRYEFTLNCLQKYFPTDKLDEDIWISPDLLFGNEISNNSTNQYSSKTQNQPTTTTTTTSTTTTSGILNNNPNTNDTKENSSNSNPFHLHHQPHQITSNISHPQQHLLHQPQHHHNNSLNNLPSHHHHHHTHHQNLLSHNIHHSYNNPISNNNHNNSNNNNNKNNTLNCHLHSTIHQQQMQQQQIQNNQSLAFLNLNSFSNYSNTHNNNNNNNEEGSYISNLNILNNGLKPFFY